MAILIYNVDSGAICVIATIIVATKIRCDHNCFEWPRSSSQFLTLIQGTRGEDFFFYIKKNKTPGRSSLFLSGTFQCSIITENT